ncbi:hypothetical protein [Microbacterium sp. A84]|uniref:hypothetical protein n=1 Tax=Microbacterium sp. A84 TaxID=3450715 RepID=UPI003F43C0BF
MAGAPVAHPALVWDIAIGQSTVVTHHVKANLFYRNLTFHRFPLIGATLTTATTVVGLRENSRREGRPPTGLAALRMHTADQHDRTVLDFYRCAMLPLRGDLETGHADDLSAIGGDQLPDPLEGLAGLDLAAFPSGGPLPAAGTSIEVIGGDVVSSAPELARLPLNIAAVHHDESANAQGCLVYGGHTIGLAMAQVTRVIPGLVTVLGWDSCDHTGPVREGQPLRSILEVEHAEPGPQGTTLLRLRSRVTVDGGGEVLDWRLLALAK